MHEAIGSGKQRSSSAPAESVAAMPVSGHNTLP